MEKSCHTVLRKSIFLALSLFLATTPAFAQTTTTTLQQKEEQLVTKVENAQLYQEALSFLNTLDAQAYQQWKHPFYSLTPQQEAEMRTYLNDEIIKGVSDDYEKAKLIFNWVHNNVSYAYDLSNAYLHPYDIFVHRSAVCGGYSNLYKAFLNLAGIPAVNVTGILTSISETASHEWNAVYINGSWFYADATWGNEHFNNEALFSNQYKTIGIYQAVRQMDGLTIGFDEGVSVVGVDPTMVDVKIPSQYQGLGVHAISEQFFLNANEVCHMDVPDTIRTIKVATGANKLETIHVDEKNPYYASKDDALFTKDYRQILLYPKKRKATQFTLPAQTMNYDFKETFDNPYLESLHVEEGNLNFQSYDGAIYSTGYKELYTVPYGVKQIRIKGGSQLSDYALSSREQLEYVIIEDGVTALPQGTFAYCTSLKEVQIPASIKTIGNDVFASINPNQLVIKGYEQSVAQQYAHTHGIRFEAIKEVVVAPTQENIALLEADIQAAKQRDLKDFTPQSVALFKQAVVKAEEDLLRYKKQEGSNDECIKSIQDLQAAYGILEIKPIRLSTYSISMKGNIALNLYLEIQPEVFQDEQAYLLVTKEDQTKVKVMLKDLDSIVDQGNTYYHAEIFMLAKQMNDVLATSVCYKGQMYDLPNLCIQNYANYILQADDTIYDRKTKDAIIAMLNYGASAQTYFHYKSDQLVNDILDPSQKVLTVTKEDLSSYKPVYGGDLSNLTYQGSSVLVKSDNSISHYFKPIEKDIKDFTFTCQGQTLTPVANQNVYYVDINNIYAKNLGKAYRLVVTDSTNKQTTLDYSVLSYVYLVLHGNYEKPLQDLAKSLYAYQVAADAYAKR